MIMKRSSDLEIALASLLDQGSIQGQTAPETLVTWAEHGELALNGAGSSADPRGRRLIRERLLSAS
jgi:hypothetical protein